LEVFSRTAQSDTRLDTVEVPLGNGLLICRRA
jgi:hypothetical protein